MTIKRIVQYNISKFLLFIGGVVIGIFIYKIYSNHRNIINCQAELTRILPDSVGVRIDSTNLPIIFIETQGQQISRNEFITGRMKIIDNKLSLNFEDTTTRQNQSIDYDGYISIRYRGHGSFGAKKKPYAIRVLDKPLSEGGKKKKSELLGMRKGKKWVLIANHYDKSMLRNALTYELAQPFIGFVPKYRFCEVFIDNVYYGVYMLCEQITADRLKLKKASSDGKWGGYLFQLDHRMEKGSILSQYWKFSYLYEYPDSTKITSKERNYIQKIIYHTEDLINSHNISELKKTIDIQSMIDYQIITELSHNPDGYTLSTFMYKKSDEDDNRFKFSIWDYDAAYGYSARIGCSDTDTWMYEFCSKTKDWPFSNWWSEIITDPNYEEMFRESWKHYRKDILSDKRIYSIIDSLSTILTNCGAEQRNARAWYTLWHNDWRGPERLGTQKYVSTSYQDELYYLKSWLEKRLKWMDKQLITKENISK